MSDLIDRQKALDAIQQRADRVDSVYSAFWEGLIIAQDIVKNVPSSGSERKYGEWLPHPHEREWDVCSVCGTGCKRREFEMQFGQERFTEYGYQYCPHCGAEMMRGEL